MGEGCEEESDGEPRGGESVRGKSEGVGSFTWLSVLPDDSGDCDGDDETVDERSPLVSPDGRHG